MIRNADLEEQLIVVHDKTAVEYLILSHRAQVKVKDGIWEPAITYKLKTDSHWSPIIYIRDTASFMHNFSLPKEPEDKEALIEYHKKEIARLAGELGII